MGIMGMEVQDVSGWMTSVVTEMKHLWQNVVMVDGENTIVFTDKMCGFRAVPTLLPQVRVVFAIVR